MPLSYKQLVHFFFPPSIDEQTLMQASSCTFTPQPYIVQPHIHALLSYKNPAVQAAIHLAKFHHNPDALHVLSSSLADYMHTAPHYILIPVPLSPKRQRERGYNQVTEIITYARFQNKNIKNLSLLQRTRHTPPQTSLDKAARIHNLTNAFTYRPSMVPKDIHSMHLIILDDVTTTGTTLKAAYHALTPLRPASLSCLALAH